MIDALQAAGFPGVEKAGGVIHARLSASGAEFAVEPVGGTWRFSLYWPVRATAAQMAGFVAKHPGAAMDICQGETRVTVMTGPEGLAQWAALAEAAVAAMCGWRRLQRAPGEGM